MTYWESVPLSCNIFPLSVCFRPGAAVLYVVGLAVCGFESLTFYRFLNHAFIKKDYEDVWIFVKCRGRIQVVISLLSPFLWIVVLFLARSEIFEKFSRLRERLYADEETCCQDLVSFRYHALRR